MKSKPTRLIMILGLASALALVLALMVIASPLYAESALQPAAPVALDLEVRGDLAPGVLGLPGEPITWLIIVKNVGSGIAQDVTVTNTLHDALRVADVQTARGTISVNEQIVVYSLPALNPGETIELAVQTTVLHSPVNGKLVNQVLLAATGSDGTVAQRVSAEVFVPTGLPATGYAPPSTELPGEGEPSVVVFGMGAFSVVGLVAAFVWYRGRRQF